MVFTAILASLVLPRQPFAEPFDRMRALGLSELGAHRMLVDLTKRIGPRLSGSEGAAKSIVWVEKQMREIGLTNIHRIPCMVPKWVRGDRESAAIVGGGKLAVCALGMSIGTPSRGIEAEVIEVHSLKEAQELGRRGRGKIVFYNRGFDPKLASTFEAYGGAVDQRFGGADAASKSGAVAVLVRSMTLSKDDEPHTGSMGYAGGVKKIPAAALGIQSADRLSKALKKGKVRVTLVLSCKTYPDVPSASVAGDIQGSELPEEIIDIGGHLDSWDLGTGAHDDGAGITQSLEVARIYKKLGLRPKRTIRIVAWMNEENGGRGAKTFAEKAAKEKHYAAMESDAGGFMPRAFGVSKTKLERVMPWLEHLRPFGIEQFIEGGADADNAPLEPLGATLFSLTPENQRYFDVHHSRNDTIGAVNPRELEFGALAMASLAWLVSEEGLD